MNNHTVKSFKCTITGYIIQYRLIDNLTAIMDTIYTDYQNINALSHLIRISIDGLGELGVK